VKNGRIIPESVIGLNRNERSDNPGIRVRNTPEYAVNSKSAKDVTAATIELLMPYKAHVHTITADNGREFANHEEIAEALEADVYFAHPYSSWERGANENANGLLRQYVPKGSDLREVSEDVISLAMARINYRPKKCLGFKQPAVIFKEMCMAA